MQEVFKRDYQVYYIQCMQSKLHQYIGNNVWGKTSTDLVIYFERTIYKQKQKCEVPMNIFF